MSHVQIFLAVPSRASWPFAYIPGGCLFVMPADGLRHSKIITDGGSPALLIDAVLGFLAPRQPR